MRSLLIVLAVVGVVVARPGFLGLGLGARSLLHAPVAYSSVAAPLAYSTVAAAPVTHHISAPLSVSSQYHAQDELGQYSYGYAGGPSAKSEVKTFDGVTRGGYSYVDANGVVQNVNYVADAVNGFRVAATNLPVAPEPIPTEPLVAPVPVEDTVEVASAKQAHFAAVAQAKTAAEAAPEITAVYEPAAVNADILPGSVVSRNIEAVVSPAFAYGAVAPAAISYSGVTHAIAPVSRFAYSAVAPIAVAPAFSYNAVTSTPTHYSAVAPAIAHGHLASSQYHAQDELGQYSYGYAGGPSAKSEVKTFDGVTRGGYSYVDANGVVQNVNYVADAAHGFRVAATNLPVAPEPIPAEPLVAPIPVEDTAEVAAAKVAHSAAYAEAKAAAEAAPEVVHAVAVEPAAVTVAGAYHPALAYGAVAPAFAHGHLAYAAAPVAHGFSYATTNLPVAHVAHYAQVVDDIPDTAEVAAAKAQHYAAHLEAKARLHGLY